jgi:hypothetical protein
LEERALPSGWDSEAVLSSHFHTVLLLKGWKRNKVTVQKHVERLHDLVDGHQVLFCTKENWMKADLQW